MNRLFLILLLAISSATFADEYLIRNARVFTGTGTGIIEATDIYIEDGKIERVGRDLSAPSAKVIDADGALVTPGLFDSRTHLGLAEVENLGEPEDARVTEGDTGAGFRVAFAVNRFSSQIPMVRAEGVTRALVAPEAGVEVLAGQSAIIVLDESRQVLADRSNAVFVYLGEKGKEYAGGSRARGLLDLLTTLREAELYSDNRRAYDRRQLKSLNQSEVDLRALLPVLAGDKPLALYIDRAADIEAAIRELAEFDLDIVIVGGREAWKVRTLLADREIPVVVNPLDNVPSSFDRLGARLDNAAMLSEAGVTVAFMTEDQYSEFRMLTQGAGVAVAWGLPWEEALAAITSNPAKIWGIDDYGTIEPGKDADIVIWDDDPLEVTSAPTTIFVRGEVIDGTNRQTLLRDRYSDLDKAEPPFGYR